MVSVDPEIVNFDQSFEVSRGSHEKIIVWKLSGNIWHLAATLKIIDKYFFRVSTTFIHLFIYLNFVECYCYLTFQKGGFG